MVMEDVVTVTLAVRTGRVSLQFPGGILSTAPCNYHSSPRQRGRQWFANAVRTEEHWFHG
jgi:hypothetical protein